MSESCQNGFDWDTWVAVLSAVFEVDVVSRLDSIDITWDRLDDALVDMDPRDILALKLRYGDKLTFRRIGQTIRRRDNATGPLTPYIASCIIRKALRRLRHRSRLKVLKANIVPWWNLKRDYPAS